MFKIFNAVLGSKCKQNKIEIAINNIQRTWEEFRYWF